MLASLIHQEHTRQHTWANNGHVHQDVQPDLPVLEGSPDVAQGKLLCLSYRRVIVLFEGIDEYGYARKVNVLTLLPNYIRLLLWRQEFGGIREVNED